MYHIDIKTKVHKFIISLKNSEEILKKLKLLKFFKTDRKLTLDIKKLQGQKKNIELYRLRIGEVRFIFQVLKKEKTIWVKLANFRGSVYS